MPRVAQLAQLGAFGPPKEEGYKAWMAGKSGQLDQALRDWIGLRENLQETRKPVII